MDHNRMDSAIAAALARHADARRLVGHSTLGYPPVPATDAELGELENSFGSAVHPDVKSWFRCISRDDGQSRCWFTGSWHVRNVADAVKWRAAMHDPGQLEHWEAVKSFVPLLTCWDIDAVVDARRDTPSAVKIYDTVGDTLLTPFAPTLLDAIERWTAEIEPPPDW